MQIGIILPSYMYSFERKRLATNAFYSLMRTETLQRQTTLLLLVKAGHAVDYASVVEGLAAKFRVILKTDDGLEGTEQTLAFGTSWALENLGVDTIVWMGDDALFNPLWLWKLAGLMQRHPKAKSWSVYRSAFEWLHRTLDDSGEDVRVRSICGHGMSFTKKEWEEWGVDWRKLPNEVEEEQITLDILHSEQRPGERWVTKESWLQHTGKVGVHCKATTPEFARDFKPVAF